MKHSLFLTPKWLVGHCLAFGLIALFLWAGFWQLDRLAGRIDRNAILLSRMSTEPLPLANALARYQNETLNYRPITVEGTYDSRYDVLLRTAESYDGQAVNHLLTPLVIDGNQAIIVNRGAVPYEDGLPIQASVIPEPVQVSGLLLPDQDPVTGFWSYFAPRDPAEGSLETIGYADLDRLAEQMPYELVPAYLEAHQQRPSIEDFPRLLRPDALTNGPHLGYAIQWFSFAAIGVIGYAVLLRQVQKDSRRQTRSASA